MTFAWTTGDPALEQEVNRLNTEAFISSHATEVVFIPMAFSVTGTGTQWTPGEPREPQVVRIVDQSWMRGGVPGMVRARDGQQRKVEYQVVARHDAEMELYDFFTDADGIKWEVAELLPDNGYERRAQVIRYGEG
jgi:hypothetical protein